VSPRTSRANSGKEARQILLKPLEEIGCKLNLAFISFISSNSSFEQNADSKTIAKTFSLDSTTIDLCGILPDSFSMSSQSVAIA